MAIHFVHNWYTHRDDGFWLYQECVKCKLRRTVQKAPFVGQPANPAWMQGGKLPTPIGEKGTD